MRSVFSFFHLAEIFNSDFFSCRASFLARVWKDSPKKSGSEMRASVIIALILCLFLIPSTVSRYVETRDHMKDLSLQRKDNEEWWGIATKKWLELIDKEREVRPGRGYAGARWNWGNAFDLKFLKWYTLWTLRGHQISNIGMMWHAMGLMSEMDFYFDERREDHYVLFNIRYVVCGINLPFPPSATIISDVVSNHAVHFVNVTEGYFSLVKRKGCFDAWNVSKDMAWAWRKEFVLSRDSHTLRTYPRVALTESDRCDVLEEKATMDQPLPRGSIGKQQGNDDIFRATIDCQEEEGCHVLLRVSYHPHFRVRNLFTGDVFASFVFAPSFIGFRVPKGAGTYLVEFTTPMWSKLLWLVCYGGLGALLLLALFWRWEPSWQDITIVDAMRLRVVDWGRRIKRE